MMTTKIPNIITDRLLLRQIVDSDINNIFNGLPHPDIIKYYGVNCVLGLHKCSDEHPCPMHHQYAKTRDSMLRSFQETTIAKLAGDLNDGSVHVKNAEAS